MAQSAAQSVDEYIGELAPDRQKAIATVREVILDHLPEGFEENMQYGMISYVIPLEKYPMTYNRQRIGTNVRGSGFTENLYVPVSDEYLRRQRGRDVVHRSIRVQW